MITAEALRQEWAYEPESGAFKRRASKRGSSAIQKSRNLGDYIKMKVSGTQQLAHRMAWIYVNGAINGEFIDHVNGNKSDNRISNLRVASRHENQYNAKKQKNAAFYKNVSAKNDVFRSDRFVVSIQARGVRHIVCGFNTAELASEFAGLMRESLHGGFANNGTVP